jgi:hypothetical protein
VRHRDRGRVEALAAALVLAAGLVLATCGPGEFPPAGEGPSSGATTKQSQSAHTHDHGHSAAANATPASPLRPGERFLQVTLPPDGYAPAGPSGGKDDYRCFLVDPQLTAPAFVTGAEVLPGLPDIVHHAILFRVDPGQVAAAEARDDRTPGNGWTCFGGSDVPAGGAGADPVGALNSAPWLAGWAPGGGESVFGGGTGVRLPAGSRIILQVHYNLRSATRPGLTDHTQVRLRLAPGSAHLKALQTMLLPAPIELPCTAREHGPLCDRGTALLDLGARFGPQAGRTVAGLQLLCGGDPVAPRAGPTQHCDRAVREPMVVRAVAGHMHLLGRSISVTLDPGTPGERTLLDRKVWDFDNQKATPLPTAVRVPAGHTLRVTCTHDPSLRSMVPALQTEQPRYVTWGEGTSDEMCLGIVLYTRR